MANRERGQPGRPGSCGAQFAHVWASKREEPKSRAIELCSSLGLVGAMHKIPVVPCSLLAHDRDSRELPHPKLNACVRLITEHQAATWTPFRKGRGSVN